MHNPCSRFIRDHLPAASKPFLEGVLSLSFCTLLRQQFLLSNGQRILLRKREHCYSVFDKVTLFQYAVIKEKKSLSQMIYKITDQKTSENLIKISMAGFNFLFNFRSQNCNFIKNKLQRLSSKIHQIFQNTKSG